MVAEEKIVRIGCSCRGSERGRLPGEGEGAAGYRGKERGRLAAAVRVRVRMRKEKK